MNVLLKSRGRGDMPSIVALIPARSGSRRVTDKNVRRLGEHPLLAYSIAAALQSGIFSAVVVSTDSAAYAAIARRYGAQVPFLRPDSFAGDVSPDIDWVAHALGELGNRGQSYDCFSILRPTSPFRLPQTIRRAWQRFLGEDSIDSLRAVEKCRQHPGKMWVLNNRRMMPLLPLHVSGQPWHSSQYQSLPDIYVQNASLEIAWTRAVTDKASISGDIVTPFLTEGYEGVDINTDDDWQFAEYLLYNGLAKLPAMEYSPSPETEPCP